MKRCWRCDIDFQGEDYFTQCQNCYQQILDDQTGSEHTMEISKGLSIVHNAGRDNDDREMIAQSAVFASLVTECLPLVPKKELQNMLKQVLKEVQSQ